MVKKLFCIGLLLSAVSSSMLAQQPAAIGNKQDESTFSEMKIYPNPLKEGTALNVKLTGFSSDNLLVVVYDTFGREMYSRVAVYESGGYYFSFDNENRLPAGVYLVIASSNDQIFRQRLVVQQ